MKVQRISAVTLIIENMKKSCSFYSQIPGFKLVYGGSSDDSFTTFQIGEDVPKKYLNLELNRTNNNHNHGCAAYDDNHRKQRQYFGRIIFHTKDVDGLYSCFRSNEHISNLISFENEPTNASWGERYFHIREPDGYQIPFAQPIADNKEKV